MSYPAFHPSSPIPAPDSDLPLEEFRRLFPRENEHVEFKQGVSVRKVQEAAVAFSNASGGVVCFGVAPDGRITGLPDPGEKARLIHQVLAEACNLGRYDVRSLTVEGTPLLVLSVDRRHEGFAQTSDGVVRVRRGASNRPLIGTDLSRFVAERAFSKFERTGTRLPVESANPAHVERVRAALAWPGGDLSERLREIGLVERERGVDFLTVAGALHLLEDPSKIGCRAYIDLRRFTGEDTEPDKIWRVTGTAAEQVEHATRAVLDELGSVSAIIGATRVDLPRLPPGVVREAVANAVAHRSYELSGSATRIDIRPDEVAITSPGALPEPVTIESIRHQQSARNDALIHVLRCMGLTEDQGLGIDRIEDGMQADLLLPPTFTEDGSFFTVTLPLSGHVTPRERVWVRQLIDQGRLDARSAPLVVHAARYGAVSNTDARNILGVDSVVARSMLQRLASVGVLAQQGKRGGARYVVARDLGIPARVRYSDEELAARILQMADSGPVTNAQIREQTGLDRVAVVAALRRLVDTGLLVQEGSKRGTTYARPPVPDHPADDQ